ncbi:MAG: T9SS type A sorting domain-containing protein [Vicingaceae bacterium]
MKVKKVLTISVLVFAQLLTQAKGPSKEDNNSNRRSNQPTLAAGCSPAKRITYLEYNNVRTRVETGGLWWQDRANGNADYEVPVNSNSFALYAGGLWLGGTDVNGQLKAAVSKFGQGVDYWTGPLDTTGTAEIDAATCDDWDRFFEISEQEVAEFVLYRQAIDEGTASEDFPDYQIPESILNWPGNGDYLNKGEALKLAPFIDVDGDGLYNPEEGDYPFYDLGEGFNSNVDSRFLSENGTVDCRAQRLDRSESASRPLFGDKTYWWIFNDKGNLHTESNAPSIGMEIHGQAFAFATNDAVNDMTFYNFELINRSTFTLTDTYFASYVDPDLGNPADDYVGCDVQRGFGYCYNGDDLDEDFNGQTGYGTTPAVIGIDFFEGPYQDADGEDNEVGIGPGQALNGLGYSDSIPDNERFGMRRFVYYNIGGGQNGDPTLAIHYYNYMRGIWQNGQRMLHGGDGLATNGVEEDLPTAFMFPGDTDPLHWGLVNDQGIVPRTPNNTNWTEQNPGGGSPNAPGDRRFLQSAGPFTLRPGNVNDITVGVVFAQAEVGGRAASFEKSISADDKAQALFDNCFQVLDGPDAPTLTIQELDQELIVYLSNSDLSNNVNEEYEEVDPNIITPDSLVGTSDEYDNKYRFQGYQVYQLKGADVSVSEVEDISVSRLVFQCDIKDNVTTLTNFTFDEGLQANFPTLKVQGENDGIVHSFKVTEDLFAQGNSQLVNYKTYYYVAIAYAYNEYKPYVQDQAPDPANPLVGAYDGQKLPYLGSRKAAGGGSIESVAAIPHSITPEEGGTVTNSSYGDLIPITRLQGTGNGDNGLELTDATIDRLMQEKNWEDTTGSTITKLDYKAGSGPVTVKVVDPLNTVNGKFYFQMLDTSIASKGGTAVTDSAYWKIWKDGGTADDTVYSNNIIRTRTEQLLFEPNWGLSILIEQTRQPGADRNNANGYISSRVDFADPTKPWLSGISDGDAENPFNWILSGTSSGEQAQYGDRINARNDFIDPNQDYENILQGTISPYGLVGFGTDNDALNKPGFDATSVRNSELKYLYSFVLVFTNDKSKWTRSPVIEQQEDSSLALFGDEKYRKMSSGSIDKNGRPWQTGDPVNLDDPESPAFIDSMGMGWFPGYAINLETGERLNIAYGEDSYYGVDGGGDLEWNPSDRVTAGGNLVWGGKHVIYIFRKTLEGENRLALLEPYEMPVYDYGKNLSDIFNNTTPLGPTIRTFGWSACSWVAMPVVAPGQELLATEARVYVKVAKPYDTASTNITKMENGQLVVDSVLMNGGRPVYEFQTDGRATLKQQTDVLKDALDEINVVPNPYYAVSEYENSAIDNRVKITNLPTNCTIKIYNMSGTLIRTYQKGDPLNFLDWDLTNQVGIPIASGVYIIHVEVPGVGEKILKWFGVMRPVDLNNF